VVLGGDPAASVGGGDLHGHLVQRCGGDGAVRRLRLGSDGLLGLGGGRRGRAGGGAVGDVRLAALVAALDHGEPDEADPDDARGDQGGGPVGAAPLRTDAFRREAGGGGGRGRTATAVLLLVPRHQGGGVEGQGLGKGPEVPAGVDVPAAGREVGRLDGA